MCRYNYNYNNYIFLLITAFAFKYCFLQIIKRGIQYSNPHNENCQIIVFLGKACYMNICTVEKWSKFQDNTFGHFIKSGQF